MRHRSSISKFCLSLGLAVSTAGGYGFLPLSLLTATTLTTIASPNAAQASILSSWEYNPSTQELEVMVPGGTTPRFFLEAEPARIILELPGTDIGTVTTQRTYGGTVREIRVAQFDTGMTRIVLELAPGTVLAPGHAELRQVGGGTGSDRWVLRPLLATGASIASGVNANESTTDSMPPSAASAATASNSTTPDPTASIANNSAPSSTETGFDPLPPLEPGATEIPVEMPAPATEPDATEADGMEPGAVAVAVPEPDAESTGDEDTSETTEIEGSTETDSATTSEATEEALEASESSEEASETEIPEAELTESETSATDRFAAPTAETDSEPAEITEREEAETSDDAPAIAAQPEQPFPSPTLEATSEATSETATSETMPALETTNTPTGLEAAPEVTPGEVTPGVETAPTPNTEAGNGEADSREAEVASGAEPSMLPPPDFSALPSVAPAPVAPAPVVSTLSELPPSSSPIAPPSSPPAASTIPTTPPTASVPEIAVVPPVMSSNEGSLESASSPANSPGALVTAAPRMTTPASPTSIANRSIEFGQPLPPSTFSALPSVTPNLAAAPSQAMTSSIRIPSGTVLNVRYPGEAPLELVEGQSRQEVLVLSQAVQDASGKVILPEGSYVIGRFEAQDDGNLFVAQAISLEGRNILLRAQSEPLGVDRQLDDRLWQNSALGVAAGLVLGGITGIGLIPAIAAGAATSAATTYVTAPQSVVVQPDQVLEIRLTEDFNWMN